MLDLARRARAGSGRAPTSTSGDVGGQADTGVGVGILGEAGAAPGCVDSGLGRLKEMKRRSGHD
jgi:hypothetical protein